MYYILPIKDTFLVLGIQDLTQLCTLNPIFLGIGNSPAFHGFVIKYSPKKYFYRLSTMILNVGDGNIIVSCVGLNDYKKKPT